jgi:hypothetical protein
MMNYSFFNTKSLSLVYAAARAAREPTDNIRIRGKPSVRISGETCSGGYEVSVKKLDGETQIDFEERFKRLDDAMRILSEAIKAGDLAATHESATGDIDPVLTTIKISDLQAWDELSVTKKERLLVPREREALLNIIGSLRHLLRDKLYDSDAEIINTLLTLYPQVPGISESNLKSKFSDAKKCLARHNAQETI